MGELTKTEHRWMILLQLFSLSGDEGDEHKWVIPSAVSADTHKELTVRQMIQHLGLFASDCALESKIPAFFARRADLALLHVSHLQDPTEIPQAWILTRRAKQTSLSDYDSPRLSSMRIGSVGSMPRSFKPLCPHP